MVLKSLETVLEIAKSKPAAKMAVAAAADDHALDAVKEASKAGIISPILVGDKNSIKKIADKLAFNLDGIEIIDETDPVKSCAIAVSMIRSGKAQILMKGLVGTAFLLRAVLNKENGISRGTVMSHAALLESPQYHKLLCITDCGMNILPTLNEKADIINNVVEIYKKLKLDKPKIGILAAVELINEKMEATTHAAMLVTMNRRGQIKDCIIDGPLAFDNIISKEACDHKGIITEIGGDADVVILPNIETGNTLYKALVYLGGATVASVALGASAPIVLTSRSDSDRSKLMSIALAAAMQ
ncbi:MAG TPA: bifunctional enoyl-CoA hydratase/phosphate acetyltransferase [Spirochaetota bacterium]|nr:bifunctional enoyl-CoA hydratase/phosphate acetyltransferase [Spirochaetota bacterium]HPS86688.1 bifunctional enoyl-CoA hydratase/phosphate acetyltransferase [Spirochaetota bacterium]